VSKEPSQTAPKLDAEAIVADSESGARNPSGWVGRLLPAIALVWSFFQLYAASDLPFMLQEYIAPSIKAMGLNMSFIVSNTQGRYIFLAFALVLAALAYPLFTGSPRDRVPWYDWVLAALGVMACAYLLVFQDSIAERAGSWQTNDIIISFIGMTVLMIAVYRTIGLPLLCVAAVFVLYVFFGDKGFVPDALQWKGASFGKAMWHYWMQTEGVFGVPIGVAASMIYMFVLFGALLEKAGAGNYFVKVAFALLGHLEGGPAKAAVVSSGLSGIYSGSSIANVVSTGTFTIPLMKRTGFPAEKAGAVEVAASTNGQLTPPVMGAAAFLMAEFIGIPYEQVLKHAILPAIISYIALFYIVHLEALKLGLKGLPKRPSTRTAIQKLMGVLAGFIIASLLAAFTYYGLGWLKPVFGDWATPVICVIFVVVYLAIIHYVAKHPDIEFDDPKAKLTELPPAGPTAVTGLHFLLPIILLLWCIMVERFSPSKSAFLATLAMIFVMVTQHAAKVYFRNSGDTGAALRQGWDEFIEGMIGGGRNMISIGVATGAAGIIIGSLTLTGAHQIVQDFVEVLSGGNLMVMLILVAIISLILGMGLPTTVNYIVVSSLMVQIIVELGAQNGLIVPLVAVHMFVFYFGILADDTPPVGLAAFAAAAISGGDPIKTGIQGFTYDIRTAILPFLFIFNTELLLINVGPFKAVIVFIVATVAMLVFAAATQGFFFTRSKIWETVALLLIAFTLFRPGFWLDKVSAPYVGADPTKIVEFAAKVPEDGSLRAIFAGEDIKTGKQIEKTVILPLGKAGEGLDRLRDGAGLEFRMEEGKTIVDNLTPRGFAERQKIDFDWEVKSLQLPAERFPKELFYIPAFLLLGLVIWLQRRRRDEDTATA